MEGLIKIADDKGQAHRLAIFLADFVQKILQRLDPAEYLGKVLKSFARQLDLSPVIRNFIIKATENREDDKWIEMALDKLAGLAEAPETRQKIYAFIKEKEKEKTTGGIGKSILGFIKTVAERFDAYNAEELADYLHRELIATIKEIKDPNHILRLEIRDFIQSTVSELEGNKKWQEKIEAWKNGVLDRVSLREVLETLFRAAVKAATAPTSEIGGGFFKKAGSIFEIKKQVNIDDESLLLKWVAKEFEKYWNYLKRNSNIKDWLDMYIKKVIDHIIEKEHHLALTGGGLLWAPGYCNPHPES